MIVSFFVGLLKAHPVWLVLVILAGTGLDLFTTYNSDAWRIEAGLAPADYTIIGLFLWVAGANVLSYALGRGLRWLYDRFRRANA